MYLQSAHQTKINIFIYAVFFICSFIVNILEKVRELFVCTSQHILDTKL